MIYIASGSSNNINSNMITNKNLTLVQKSILALLKIHEDSLKNTNTSVNNDTNKDSRLYMYYRIMRASSFYIWSNDEISKKREEIKELLDKVNEFESVPEENRDTNYKNSYETLKDKLKSSEESIKNYKFSLNKKTLPLYIYAQMINYIIDNRFTESSFVSKEELDYFTYQIYENLFYDIIKNPSFENVVTTFFFTDKHRIRYNINDVKNIKQQEFFAIFRILKDLSKQIFISIQSGNNFTYIIKNINEALTCIKDTLCKIDKHQDISSSQYLSFFNYLYCYTNIVKYHSSKELHFPNLTDMEIDKQIFLFFLNNYMPSDNNDNRKNYIEMVNNLNDENNDEHFKKLVTDKTINNNNYHGLMYIACISESAFLKCLQIITSKKNCKELLEFINIFYCQNYFLTKFNPVYPVKTNMPSSKVKEKLENYIDKTFNNLFNKQSKKTNNTATDLNQTTNNNIVENNQSSTIQFIELETNHNMNKSNIIKIALGKNQKDNMEQSYNDDEINNETNLKKTKRKYTKKQTKEQESSNTNLNLKES